MGNVRSCQDVIFIWTETLKEWSPDIYNLVKYVTDGKDHDKGSAEGAREVLFKKTTHTAIFEK